MGKKIFKLLTNKWILISLVFVVFMAFFSNNNFTHHRRLSKTVEKLQQEREYYQSEITKDSMQIEDLKNPSKMEKYAREKYLMKKKNEDIYLVVEEIEEEK